MRTRVLFVMAALLGAGCGSDPKPAPKAGGDEEPTDHGREGALPSIESEVGAMDEGKVQQVFVRSSNKLAACVQRGTQRLAYLGGKVSFKVRVDGAGRARWAYLSDSTLGDRATEECMLGVLKAASWPAPQGGREGLAGNEGMVFDPGGDERPPVDWSAERLGDALTKLRPALAACRSKAGTGAMKATMYVDTDGKPKSVGVSVSDEKGEAAVACVVDALSGATFPSPGSWAAKVSVPIE